MNNFGYSVLSGQQLHAVELSSLVHRPPNFTRLYRNAPCHAAQSIYHVFHAPTLCCSLLN